MKINVAFPATGCQKLFEIHDELKVKLDPYTKAVIGLFMNSICVWKMMASATMDYLKGQMSALKKARCSMNCRFF